MQDDLWKSLSTEQEWLLKAIRKMEWWKFNTISEGNTIWEEQESLEDDVDAVLIGENGRLPVDELSEF